MDKPSFILINKLLVSIQSIKNSLKKAETMYDLAQCAEKIIALQNKMHIERTRGLSKLQAECATYTAQLDTLQRALYKVEAQKSLVESKLKYNLSKSKIESIDADILNIYSERSKHIT